MLKSGTYYRSSYFYLLKSNKMTESATSCIKSVGGMKVCGGCKGKLLRHGSSSSGKNRYKCKICGRTQVDKYMIQTPIPRLYSLPKKGLASEAFKDPKDCHSNAFEKNHLDRTRYPETSNISGKNL